MGKKRLILFASLLALAAVFTYSSARLISNLSATASFFSYHTTTHSCKQEKKLKGKQPLKSVVKIKIRYVGAEYNYALQNIQTISIVPTINEGAIFTPQVSFVYKYCKYSTPLRGPPAF